ncbi:MAG: OPT/YSL family transporter [Planctomycetes bacterium]|nr:OPT/YSL family transporter [Planctomycetota bacterium]
MASPDGSSSGPVSSSSDAPPVQYSPSGEVIPPLPADATPDQKDAHWFRYVYQGDRMPQLTVRAVLVGGFLGMIMSAANLYTTLSIGWAFGIAITACVISFVMWNFVVLISGKTVSQMSILENACMASTASAAGYATGSTIATMFGAIVLLQNPPVDANGVAVTGEAYTQWARSVKTWDVTAPWITVVFTLCTGLMGVFLAIPMKRQMINHERLPFPTGTAAAATLSSLYTRSAESIAKAYALVIALGAGLLIGFLRVGDEILEKVEPLKKLFSGFMEKLRIPADIHLGFIDRLYPRGVHPNGFAFEPSALLIAAGMIVGMRISLSLVVSSVILYFFVAPHLAHMDDANRAVEGYKLSFIWPGGATGTDVVITRWSLWGGTAVMVFASLASVALQWKSLARAFTGTKGGANASESAAMSAIEVPGKWMIIGMVPITIAMVALQILAFSVSWWAGLIAVAASFVLSLVASRATGETDTTPIGAMGKVMQLLFAGLAPGNINANLASAGIAANSASSSADLLTDLKTGYLLGANPRKQFLAQFFGVFFGTIAIVPIWYLMVPTREALEKFALPATRSWEAVARVLVKGVGELPESARWAILIGGLIGIGLPIIEKFTPANARKFLPSASAMGLAWVMPFQNSFSFLVGACIALLWMQISRRSQEKFNVPVASGLVAGESLMSAGLAISATIAGLLASK